MTLLNRTECSDLELQKLSYRKQIARELRTQYVDANQFILYTSPETYKYRNGLWPMQYVFLIRSIAGGKKYVTRRSRVTYFLPPARERIKHTYCMGQRPFLFLLLIYERFLTIFYAKFQRYFTQKHGTLFVADVVWT